MKKRSVQTNSRGLEKLCRELPWSSSSENKREAAMETFNQMKDFFSRYGCGTTLGVLASIWRQGKAISFWECLDLPVKSIPNRFGTIAYFYPRAYNGGVERVQAELFQIWTSMGYQVLFLCEEPANPRDYSYPEEVKRIVIPPAAEIKARLETLERIIKENRVDIFINSDWLSDAVIWENALTRLFGIPYVVYCHGLFSSIYDGSNDYTLLSYRAFKMCSLILSLSKTGAEYNQLCGCRSYLLKNPISNELQGSNRAASLQNHHVLWIGRFAKGKRAKDLAAIFSRVLNEIPDAVLDVVGKKDGEYDEVRALCEDYGIISSVHFHGYRENVVEFYLNSSVLLYTSEKEGYPISLIECKAFGLPCVMYELPYLDLVSDGKGILSAPVGDVDRMAEHVISLLTDDRKRFDMGKEARESFEMLSEYDVNHAWNEIFDLAYGKKVLSEAYYDPSCLSVSEKRIIPMMLDEMYKSVNNVRKDSVDYRVGKEVLFFPRVLSHAVRRITNREGKIE